MDEAASCPELAIRAQIRRRISIFYLTPTPDDPPRATGTPTAVPTRDGAPSRRVPTPQLDAAKDAAYGTGSAAAATRVQSPEDSSPRSPRPPCTAQFFSLSLSSFSPQKWWLADPFLPARLWFRRANGGGDITALSTMRNESIISEIQAQLKHKNVTVDVKANSDPHLSTTVTVEELGLPGLKNIMAISYPHQAFGRVAENLAHLMYSVLMTGYMFRSAQHHLELQQSLEQISLPEPNEEKIRKEQMELIHFGNVKVAGEEIDSTRTSSAPIILQLDHITPWSSFYDAVSQDFKSESMNCFSVIKATWGWDALDERAASDGGLLDLSKLFRACKTLKYAYSIRNWLWTAFAYTAMVDYPTPANFLQNLPAYPVKEMCKIIDGFPAGADVLDKAFAAASLYYNYTGDQTCTASMAGSGRLARRWSCGPMTVSNESMFPPSTFSYEERNQPQDQTFVDLVLHCTIFLQKIEKVLKRFGSNIIFSNGMRDPWSRGG
uniref:Uncharacterized protein n=1 Tax=Zea mays TaxID=4577 RepID=A0A804R566_MAIZE